MREVTTEGVICVREDETRIEYALCHIALTEREDDSFEWSFRPRWSVIDLLSPPLFQGIPGLNLDLRLEEYIRRDRTPVFVSERVPAENREDVRGLLDQEGLEYLNKLEWLIRTEYRYAGDQLYVRRKLESDDVLEVDAGDLSRVGARSSQAIRFLLEQMALGRNVRGDGFRIDEANRVGAHALLRLLYLKEKKHLDGLRGEGVARARAAGGRVGRKPAAIDDIALNDMVERFERGLLTAEDAARGLGISRSTFFRRMQAQRTAAVD